MTTKQRTAYAAVLAWLLSGAALVRLAWLPGVLPLHPWTAIADRPPTQTLPLLLALVVLALGLWVAATVALTLASRVPGGVGHAARLAVRRLSPRFLRRLVETTLGVTTVLAGTSGLAHASPTIPPSAHVASQALVSHPSTGQPLLAGTTALSLSLDRPATPPEPAVPSLDRPARDPGRGLGLVSTTGPRSSAQQGRSVRVQVGDSLWRIAARSLPHGADDRQIEVAWHRWYLANRAVIGDDPDLLLPGQLLTAPHN